MGLTRFFWRGVFDLMAFTTSKGGEALGGLPVGTLSKFTHTQEPTTADLEKGSELSCEG